VTQSTCDGTDADDLAAFAEPDVAAPEGNAVDQHDDLGFHPRGEHRRRVGAGIVCGLVCRLARWLTGRLVR